MYIAATMILDETEPVTLVYSLNVTFASLERWTRGNFVIDVFDAGMLQSIDEEEALCFASL